MDAPEIAENGAVVPVSVTTTLADVTSISFLVSENPIALVASYKIPAGTVPSVANRIKMAKTSNVIVVVEAGGKLYSADQGSQGHRRRLRRLEKEKSRWHRPFACAPLPTATSPKCRR